MNLNGLKFTKDEYLFITLPCAKNSGLSIGLLKSFSNFCRCTVALVEISHFACLLVGWPASSTLGVNELTAHEKQWFKTIFFPCA